MNESDFLEPVQQAEVVARLGRYLESVKRSTRAVDDLATPLSKAIAKNCFTALQRLAILPDGNSVSIGDRVLIDELNELTRSLIRKLTKRLDLDRDKLLASDSDEWQIAFDGLPGGQFGTSTAGGASFADSLVMPTSKPVVAMPVIEKPASIKPDGFYDPSTIWLDGKTTEVKPMAYALLKYIWDRDTTHIDYVGSVMWPENEDWSEGTLANHVTKANVALIQLCSTWSLQKRGKFLKKLYHEKLTNKTFPDVKKT